MRRALVPLVIAVLGLLVAGCGGGAVQSGASTAPSLNTLLADMVSATRSQDTAHYELDGKLSLSGSGSDPAFQLLSSQPLKLHLEGDASTSAFSAEGSVSALGNDYSGKLLADQKGLYLELLGTWYGSTELGIDALMRLGRARGGSSQFEPEQALRQHADEVLTGDISDGPTLDGTATWEFKGHLDADGIARVSDEYGQPLDAQEKKALEVLQGPTDFTFDVGKDDHLLRKFELSVALDSGQLSALTSSSSSLGGLSDFDLSLTLELGNWGEPVSISPPSSFKPLSDLAAGLFSGIQNS
jgi:hypothetical protein